MFCITKTSPLFILLIASSLASYYTKEQVNKELGKKADLSALDSYVLSSKLESDYLTKTQVETELAKKADASALNAYVTSETFTLELAKKADTSALDAYVKKDSYAIDKQSLESKISQKADTTALDAYLKIADIDTTLSESGYVKQESLDTQLASYVKNDALTTKLEGYVTTSTLNGSSSIGLVNGVYEVNAISTDELNTIINSVPTVTE